MATTRSRLPKLFGLAAAALAACALAAPAPALALDWIVDHPGDLPDLDPGDGECQAIEGEVSCTLRAALDGANDGATNPDVVTFDPSMSGTVFNPATPLHVAPGTTIRGTGSTGPNAITIDGGDTTRIFEIADSDNLVEVTIQDLRIQNGRATGDSGGGAAILNGTDLTLDGVVIQGSEVGGLTAPGAGAGVYTPGQFDQVTVTDSVITGNTITTAAGQTGSGAGIYSAGGLEVTDSTISDNQILDGGGTSAQGGGIWVDTRLVMTGSTVSGNTVAGAAAEGAGIFRSTTGFAPNTIVNSTISGNGAPRMGGGGAHLGFNAQITNATFADNTGGPAGGGADLMADDEALVTLQNTVLASPGACGEVSPPGNAIVSGGYNVEAGSTCGLTLLGDRANADPMLLPLALNAPGGTETHAIGPGSAAADAADPTCGGGLQTDQRGFPREQGGPRCDAGAYEARHRTLTLTLGGGGAGGVVATGISCGSDCAESYVEGTQLTLTAVAAAGSEFEQWTGCDSASGLTCEVTMGADRLVTAGFALLPVTPPPPPPDPPVTPKPKKKKCGKGKVRKKGKCVKKRKKRGRS